MHRERLVDLLAKIVEESKVSDFRLSNGHDQKLILRHDVDSSLFAAAEFATILDRQNIKSNFFVRASSNLYNLVSIKSRSLLIEMSKNHDIGLHIESPSSFKSFLDYENAVRLQKDLIEEVIEKRIFSISWHRPNRKDLAGELYSQNLLNLYSEHYFKDFIYFSDSANSWNDQKRISLFDSISKGNSVHLLIHPEWWTFSNVGQISFKESINGQLLLMQDEINREISYFNGDFSVFN